MKIESIAIIEDDDKIRHYLAGEIQSQIDVRNLLVFANGETALQRLTIEPVNIALFDVKLPGINGIECIRKLKIVHPKMQMIVLTVYDNADTVFEAIKAGATGYLLKTTPPEKIIEAISEVNAGGSAISSQVARKIIDAFAVKSKTNDHFQMLSKREQDVLEQLSKGYRYKEMAEKLFLSQETIRTHVRNIYEKLQVNCRIEALKKTGFL